MSWGAEAGKAEAPSPPIPTLLLNLKGRQLHFCPDQLSAGPEETASQLSHQTWLLHSLGSCACMVHAQLLQLCLTLRSHAVPGSSGPWDSPGKNTGVGCYALPQGIFPTQESNLSLLHW